MEVQPPPPRPHGAGAEHQAQRVLPKVGTHWVKESLGTTRSCAF